ncbi:M15 family metallopeptidase [Aestuariibacter halophilus]|uniref:M15 family metallopeptidase n=1 Tax=Fluctibacter halophilus TaxID=226011 RepID=A0ABS8G7E5_9ALTE|nr:M15 family metallopeptidase [Aestuariibacter halophilus]MCC2615996.1 M15 family metallopeptidase [Aestuariibacter halophilus]
MLTTRQWLGLDCTHVVNVDQRHRLHPKAAQAFSALQQAAQDDGVDCQLVSGFRDFHHQARIWNNKWLGITVIRDLNDNPVSASDLTDVEKLHHILTFSALPGGSRHHWGTDMDVFDRQQVTQRNHDFQLISAEYDTDGPCATLNQWLTEHAAQFGFTRPYQTYTGGVAVEPWHLSYSPVAQQIEGLLDVQPLADAIAEQDIAGKACILAHIEALFSRYTLNQGDTP